MRLLRLDKSLQFLLIVLFGFIMAKGLGFDVIMFIKTLILILIASPLSFGLNCFFDVDEDRVFGKGKNPLASGEISKRSATLVLLILTLLLGVVIWLWFRPWLLLLAVQTLLVIMYNVPPIKFKSRTFLDVLSHGISFGVVTFSMVYLIAGGAVDARFILMNCIIFSFSVQTQLVQELRDINTDRKAGLKTTAVVLGSKRTLHLLYAILSTYVLEVLVGIAIGVLYAFDAVLVVFPIAGSVVLKEHAYNKRANRIMWLFLGYLIIRRIVG